ncbi:hypothetical protein E5D57_003075 [Metarhizium anisopliae]|nr:hypothetical protein E5D57_003075 [Metarhizium anisopliae]
MTPNVQERPLQPQSRDWHPAAHAHSELLSKAGTWGCQSTPSLNASAGANANVHANVHANASAKQ